MECSPFDLKWAFLCIYRWEGLLNFENEEHVVFYLGRILFLSHSCCFGVSVHRGLALAVQPGDYLLFHGHADKSFQYKKGISGNSFLPCTDLPGTGFPLSKFFEADKGEVQRFS